MYEPQLAEIIGSGLQEGSLQFSNNAASLRECDFVFLAYDTPVNEDDSSDTTILKQSVADLSSVMKDGSVLVVSSQSPVSFCRELRGRLRETDASLELAYSPENLRLGEAIRCYLNPGRIILGTESPAAERKCRELFSQIQAEVLCMNLESAEMVKHGINSFLAMSIVFANHLADICESAGARIDDVVRGMKTDPRIGAKAYLSCGIGFSGGTLGRDLRVLSRKNSEREGHAKIFSVIHELNGERKNSIIERIAGILGAIEGRSIGILGLTYKPETSTLRRSLPLEIANLLMDRAAKVKVYDPKADYGEPGPEYRFKVASSIKEAADGADILILLTEWREFKEYDWQHIPKLMRQPFLLDTKNFLMEDQMVANGFKYFSVGR